MLKALQKFPLHAVYQFLWNTADWVYPPECSGCGKSGYRWCPDCQQQTQILAADQICVRCGTPLLKRSLCAHCQAVPPPFTALRSWAVYKTSVRKAIHAFKYHGDFGITETLSHPLIEIVRNENWQLDWITSVPLSPQRMRERGYNQSNLLARPIAYAIQRPFKPHLLERLRDTTSQVKLNRQERIQNMQHAFQIYDKGVKNKNILIVDDVTTTGATMINCAQVLLDAGADKVYGITLARAVLEPVPLF